MWVMALSGSVLFHQALHGLKGWVDSDAVNLYLLIFSLIESACTVEP